MTSGMFNGRGKYDDLVRHAQAESNAHVVVLLICGGNRGTGFSVALADPSYAMDLPELLHDVADSIAKQRDNFTGATDA